jgi:tetrathionate reductase subunit B
MPDKNPETAVPTGRLPWEPSGKPRKMKRAGMVIDLRRCIGCHACSVSCKTEHDVALGAFRTRVRYLEQPKSAQLAFLPLLCMHCEDAPCIPACPTEAMQKKPDGRVTVEHSKCEGNTDCISACPYDAIALDPTTGIADKCDFCTHRTDVGMDPACVAACPTDTLRFGDLDDPNDPAMQYAQKHNARGFREGDGTKPTVQYVGLRAWKEEATKGGIQLNYEEDELIYVQKKD